MRYREYLKTRLWYSIRGRVLQRDRWRCRSCGQRATQVHHLKYDPDTMNGKDLRWLLSLCGKCHEATTFVVGQKRPQKEVLEMGEALIAAGKERSRERRRVRKAKKQKQRIKRADEFRALSLAYAFGEIK